MSLPSGFGGGGADWGGRGDKGLALPLSETLRAAWADPDLRSRILFVLTMFSVFAFGVHVAVPIPGLRPEDLTSQLDNPMFQMLNMFGGGALRRISIFSLGLNPYITASIIMQILYTAVPKWKQEMQDGGEYARSQQNKKTRYLTIALCLIQGWGLLQILNGVPQIAALGVPLKLVTLLFWTAGAMFMLWLGEQISERGIGNGVSLMIFAGIILSLPGTVEQLFKGVQAHAVPFYSPIVVIGVFLLATWFIVYFTTAQRRIPIQHMRRMVGTRMMGGQTSYLPLSVNMAGVMPIIFAVSLLGLPYQFSMMMGGQKTPVGNFLYEAASYLQPNSTSPLKAVLASILYTAMIFFFTYFWTAIQYNVEDISNNLKRGGSFIPGVRPGKQTKDFLDGVISRITVVGAAFISVVALLQYISPRLAGISSQQVNVIGGTSLLIMVSVALETMRQIEANLLMKQYGQ
ncbi:preprotein translocase subunit SecY [Fimbriimonas ginsengisoli]|uniref:Protein translocase subunit SecY n=1 Tax=Fimbriimonas ginsengisoli Gsoil 348 TaxID=661478 RepID=A0A068NK61_FIMGI|nr:preprotein translocase subunit SecY [Fimbriimonas ginsengisoli]AIE83968.1 preprotein translocase, SecY subunit [Fimbriimonas ginsengisoli Gsoil 348]